MNLSKISAKYGKLWHEQIGDEKEFFKKVRQRLNQSKKTDDFLYILARCVKGAVRYNANGEFNQSADNRRKGKKPQNMRKDIFMISYLLKDKVKITSVDYSKIFDEINPSDLVYMDPPYQGTSNNRDRRYYESLDYNRFVQNLELLNNGDISYIISFDGKLGNREYGEELPDELDLHRILVKVGRSTTSTLLGNNDLTYESLYVSRALREKLDRVLPIASALKTQEIQLFK